MKLQAILFLRVILLVLLAMPGVAFSQAGPDHSPISSGSPVGPEAVATLRQKVATLDQRADQLDRALQGSGDDDATLVEIMTSLDQLRHEARGVAAALRPRLASINTRLDEIGPARSEGEPAEPIALVRERNDLNNEKDQINTLLGEAENLASRVEGMLDDVVRQRRSLFSQTLYERYDISMALRGEVLEDLAAEARKLGIALSSWLTFVVTYKWRAVLLATAFSLAAAGVLLVGGRRLFANLVFADPTRENPSYLSRLSVAFWSTLLPSFSLAVFLATTYFSYSHYGLLRQDIAAMMLTLFNVIAIVYFVYSLSSSVFSPDLPNWRLVPIRSGAARVLFWLTMLMAIVNGLDFVASKINQVMASPLSLTVAKSLCATIIVGLLVAAIGLVKPYTDEDGRPVAWNPFLRAALYILGGGTVVVALLGYIGLARFISQQIVVTGAILVTMYLGFQSASAVSEIGAFKRTKLGRILDERFSFDDASEDQMGLVFSIGINLIVLCIGIPLILLQWGFQWGDIETWIYDVATEIRIGSISISLVGILVGVAIFLLGFFGTRVFQHWLDSKVMARGRVDAGLRNSIGTAVGYAGIALAVLVGISAAGIDLSNLALVAGALSLGIGFGLQNIVNNFVSGLILLAERPFKVGDWIVASGVEGTVKKISVRATEVETFRRQTVIVPNSLLINASVGNWTHRNKLGRVDIAVGVAYDNDPRRVQEILSEIIAAQPDVLKNPAPWVAFTGFGNSSLDFEARAFLADVTNQLGFQNEVRFQIYERFKLEGIEIPFPQQDLNLKYVPSITLEREPSPEAAHEAESKPRRRRAPEA
ncbi:mechanosensitive ion channel family protein [Mesorhizobium sp. CAU 1741]|uniref:mechanosensitive ion channel family protein n=1 Tax=Mesorhizobium sp. CAU 1741 TaxID=3140366 RepID=UPI00325B4A54